MSASLQKYTCWFHISLLCLTAGNFARAEEEKCALPSVVDIIKNKNKEDMTSVLEYLLTTSSKLDGGNKQCVRELIENGADINHPSSLNDLLHESIPDYDIAKLLIERGADVNWKSSPRGGLLFYAIAGGNRSTEIVKLLYENGAKLFNKDGSTVLHYAASYENTDLISYFVKKGIDPNAKNDQGNTALYNAVVDAVDVGTLKALVANGADLKASNAGPNPILIAALELREEGAAKVIRYLLDSGLDPKVRDKDDRSALYQAMISADEEFFDRIFEAETDYKSVTKYGETLLHAAAQRGSIDFFEKILDKGLDPKAKTKDGETIIHSLSKSFAYSSSLDPVLDKAIKLGVDINARNSAGQTPLTLALSNPVSRDAAFSLLNKGANPNLDRDKKGLTALHKAVLLENIELAKLLLKKGADQDAVDPHHKATPYQLCLDKLGGCSKQLIELLKPFQDAKDSARLQTEWNKWSALKEPQKIDKKQTEDLLTGLIHSFADKKKLPNPPPKWAPDEMRTIYKNLKIAKTAPWDLTAKALDLDLARSDYFDLILQAARSAEARAAGKFKPTPEQAKKVLRLILSNGKNKRGQNYDSIAWLLTKSGVELTPEILGYFEFNEEDLKRDVENMLSSDALKYQGFPSLAAIKLTKALLAYEDELFECNDDGGHKFSEISSILIWFATYADNPECDRSFFSKLALMMLEKKKICPSDRNILIRAMNSWRSANPPIQNEVVCAVAHSIDDTKPFEERSFSDVFLLSQSVGMKSQLSQSAWFEQIKAFAKLRKAHPTTPLSATETEIYRGLLKQILGSPAGKIKTTTTTLPVAKSDPVKNTIPQLCRVSKSMPEAEFFVQFLESQLDKPRPWPLNFQLDKDAKSFARLEDEFSANGMKTELGLIKDRCPEPKKVKQK